MTDKITVAYFDGDTSKLIQISRQPTLAELRELVKGHIEFFPLPIIEGKALNLICNENGKKLFRYRPSLFLRNQDGYLVDIVFGPCLICGYIDSRGKTDIFSGITEEDFTRIQSMCGVIVNGQK